jgi:hypothetical protein
MVAHTCGPSYTGGIGRTVMVQDHLQVKMQHRLQKLTKIKKKTWGTTQVVEQLTRKHQYLVLPKKEKRKEISTILDND